MDPTVSVSKGVFVFKNKKNRTPKHKRHNGKVKRALKHKKCDEKVKGATKHRKSNRNKFRSNAGNIYSDELWHKVYSSLWKSIELKIQKLNSEMLVHTLRDLIRFITSSYKNFVSEIPAAALLTGINLPDHDSQYMILAKEIKTMLTPHVVCLNAEDSQSVKYLIETIVYQFIKECEECNSDDKCDTENSKTLKKSQCNLSLLQAWYEDLYYSDVKKLKQSPMKKQKVKDDGKVLVVIISDFEGFSPKVLQEFILIASSYLNILPFVFIFGIATSLAVLHRTLPYNVMSKINVQVFSSPSSGNCLNNVLERVLFKSDFPFRLGGKVFNLFTEIFLFYNISVTSFIQNYKYAMLEHFSQSNAMALCCNIKFLDVNLKKLSHENLEDVRRLLSFRRLVESESYENRIKLINDDEYFRQVLKKEILKIHCYIRLFHIFLKCLHILVSDLPKAPLGKHIRDIYSVAMSRNLVNSEEFKECFYLLNMQSKEELYYKVIKIISLLNEQIMITEDESKAELQTFWKSINGYVNDMNSLNVATSLSDEETNSLSAGIINRQILKERLSKMKKPLSSYEKIRNSLLNHLTKTFEKYLYEPQLLNFYEIFFFDDISIQDHIVGANRAAIHAALVDPHSYIKCICCEIPNDSQILKTMPDVCIVYKLHLEFGKLINLYDWLQAFLSIVNPNKDSDDDVDNDSDGGKKTTVDLNLQARFTQAIAELEYLGFIKSSKKKADHVTRLTWGGY